VGYGIAMSLRPIITAQGRGVIGWISDLYGRACQAHHRVRGLIGLPSTASFSKAPLAACVCS